MAERESVFFARSLHEDVSVVKYGREDSFDFGGDILDSGKIEFAHASDEKPFLFDVHDALIRDDPDIEIVVDPQEKAEEPNEDEECIFDEEKDLRIFGAEHFGEQERKDEKARDKQERKDKNDEEMGEYIEPVAVDDAQDLLVLVLASEMVTAGNVRHRMGD